MQGMSEAALAIIGTSPTGVRGPVQADRFDRFQRQVGEMEAARPGEHAALHAACHALMNGVPRVVFVGVPSLDDTAAVAAAATLLAAEGPFAACVVPGLVDPDACRAVVGALASGDTPTPVWLDAPRGAPAVAALAHAAAAGADGRLVRLVTPWIPTVSPGRRRPEHLPGSCLVAPLALGAAHTLRGVHELDRRFDPDELAALRSAGAAVFAISGPRRLLSLAWPVASPGRRHSTLPGSDIDRPSLPGGFDAFARELESELQAACESLRDGAYRGTSLHRSLERQAAAVLDRYRMAGRITQYVVRCQLEDLPGGGQAPVLEVGLRLPNRVQQVLLRMEPLG